MTALHIPVRVDGLAKMFPHRVARTSELYRLGLTGRIVHAWQELLPGVVLLSSTGTPRDRLLRAALRYAEPDPVITGYDALQLHGLPIPSPTGLVHLTVPGTNRVTAHPKLRLDRLRQPPPSTRRRGYPVTTLPRATIDAARWSATRTELTTLLRLACVHGGTTPAELWAELEVSPPRGRPAVREALDQLKVSVIDLRQARARRVVVMTGLPAPTWRRRITLDGHTIIGVADAWWDDIALAWRLLDNRRPPGPDPLSNAGVHVVRTPVTQLVEAPEEVADELRGAHARAHLATRPTVIAC